MHTIVCSKCTLYDIKQCLHVRYAYNKLLGSMSGSHTPVTAVASHAAALTFSPVAAGFQQHTDVGASVDNGQTM